MATMNKSTLFKDGDNLDLYLSTASEYTVDIEDLIEYTKEDRIIDNNQFYSKAHLYIPVGYTGVTAPAGYEFKLTENGKQQELVATE